MSPSSRFDLDSFVDPEIPESPSRWAHNLFEKGRHGSRVAGGDWQLDLEIELDGLEGPEEFDDDDLAFH